MVADHHAAVAGEHGSNQGAEVADLDFPPRPEVEERPDDALVPLHHGFASTASRSSDVTTVEIKESD